MSFLPDQPALQQWAMGEARQDTRQFAFLLVDKFSMFSLAAAIDTVRSANRLLGRDVYSWVTVSADGEAVMASNGLPIKIDYAIADLPPVDILFVCVGLTTEFPGKSTVLAGLRSLGRRGAALGALAAGSYLLAEAGQLEGHRCTIHWENRASFMERFPEIECTGNVYEIDRKRYTCAGVTTSIDLMLEIVRNDLGVELANEVANQFQHERIRSPGDRQRTGPERDLTGKSEKLKKIVELMADNLDEPYSAVQLARAASLSVRQVERLFLRHLGMTPGRYYMRLRLERARELLRQTNMAILDVAIATGFTSHSYFAQSYRQQFGRPPSEERRTTY
ncbi:transcriptional regulator, AraC family with amidase-like domain [Nitratireductor aquibiodomus]|uniref:Transcriptional regulator, AraC family with amidase-like domain n=3 Tax=Nitratireductor TaxID=245876 RepID=A0A1H4M4S6_9HYPH|nr:transcriptional regulator, AraC family with amidase-like domain [Nitratireductor aquibiodomus]